MFPIDNFDNSTIATPIYRAKALPLGDFLTNVLKKDVIVRLPYLKESRLYSSSGEYAMTSFNFMHHITSNALLPDTSKEVVSRVVGSHDFSINVEVKRFDPSKNIRKSLSVILTSPKGEDFQTLTEFPRYGEYVGFQKDFFDNEGFSNLEELALYIDPGDVIYWKKYETNKKRTDSDKKTIVDIIEKVLNNENAPTGI
jgi:hypothetical protein